MQAVRQSRGTALRGPTRVAGRPSGAGAQAPDASEVVAPDSYSAASRLVDAAVLGKLRGIFVVDRPQDQGHRLDRCESAGPRIGAVLHLDPADAGKGAAVVVLASG